MLLIDAEIPRKYKTILALSPDKQTKYLLDNVYKDGAKAQLKKVVRWLQHLPTDGHDKWYWYHQDLANRIIKELDIFSTNMVTGLGGKEYGNSRMDKRE